MERRNGFYWITSERSTERGIGQWSLTCWYLINEVGPVTDEEIFRRGWSIGEYIGSQINPS